MEVRKWSTGYQVGQWNVSFWSWRSSDSNLQGHRHDETDNFQTNVPYDYSDSDEDSDEEFNLEI